MLQIQDQSQRPLTTAHLAQTMSLLLLSNQELRDKVLSELSSNPALELVEEHVCPDCQRPLKRGGLCPVCSTRQVDEGPIVFLSPRDSYRPSQSKHEEDLPPDQEPAAPEDLTIYVLQQLAAELEPEDRSLAIYILSSLDEDGFLQDPPVILARATRSSMSQVERVLRLISHSDPPGLATAGPRDALLVQLALVPEGNPQRHLAQRVLQECFGELGRHEYEKIANHLKVSAERVKLCASFIQENLNPYPARAFWGSGRTPQAGNPIVYHAPDIIITQSTDDQEGPLMVEIFTPLSGWLRVNPLFHKAKTDGNEENSEAWEKHIERASLFVKCLQQRNNTMRRLMQILVAEQREFIQRGDRHLIAMTRAELAERIGVHESTISRAVANKAVALTDGRIVPLSKFFDRSLAVRDQIKEMIEREPKPLTDQEIAERLRKQGVRIARRTVAKYRAIEGILPARLRSRETASAAT